MKPKFAVVYVRTERAALKLGYSMFLANAVNDSEVELLNLKTLVEKQVDGIILMAGRANDYYVLINILKKIHKKFTKIKQDFY